MVTPIRVIMKDNPEMYRDVKNTVNIMLIFEGICFFSVGFIACALLVGVL